MQQRNCYFVGGKWVWFGYSYSSSGLSQDHKWNMKNIDASIASQNWRKNDKQIEWLYVPYGSFLHRGIQIILGCYLKIGERDREREREKWCSYLRNPPYACLSLNWLVVTIILNPTVFWMIITVLWIFMVLNYQPVSFCAWYHASYPILPRKGPLRCLRKTSRGTLMCFAARWRWSCSKLVRWWSLAMSLQWICEFVAGDKRRCCKK